MMKKKYKITCACLGGVIVLLVVLMISYLTTSYTVTFDSKGGTIIRSFEVKPSEEVLPPNDPVMAGFIFAGWYAKDADMEKDDKYDFGKKITEDTTIVAKWIPIEINESSSIEE